MKLTTNQKIMIKNILQPKKFLIVLCLLTLGLQIFSTSAYAQQSQNSLTLSNQVTNRSPAYDDGDIEISLSMVVVLCDSQNNPVTSVIGNGQQRILTGLQPGTYRAVSFGGYSFPAGGGGVSLVSLTNPLPRLLCSGGVSSLHSVDIEVTSSSTQTVNLTGEPYLVFNGVFSTPIGIQDSTVQSTGGVSSITPLDGVLTWPMILDETLLAADNDNGAICINDTILLSDSEGNLNLAPGTYSYNTPNYSDTNIPICSDYIAPSITLTILPQTSYYVTTYYYRAQSVITGLQLQLLANNSQVNPNTPDITPASSTNSNSSVNTLNRTAQPPSPMLLRSGRIGQDLGVYFMAIVLILTLVPAFVNLIKKEGS